MPVDFASAQKDLESWKMSYVRKVPGSKDRLSRIVMIRHSELEDVIQKQAVSGDNQRYMYVGKCSAERGFNGIITDAIPKTNQYQQVKASVSLYQIYIVDLDTVPDYELGCTEDAVLTRVGVAGSWCLNTIPPRNRYIYLVLFTSNDRPDGGNVNVNVPAPSRPVTAPTQKSAIAPPAQQTTTNKVLNTVQSRPTSSIAAAAPSKRINTVTIAVAPNKPDAPVKQQQPQAQAKPAAEQQTLKAPNGKPMLATQANSNSRPGAPAQRAPSAPLNATTLKQPNRRH